MNKVVIQSSTKFVVVLFMVFTFSFYGCKPKVNNENVVVAKVFDKELYYNDIKGIFPPKVNKKDSAALAQSYIETWVKTQLLVNKAELNLSADELNINQQIENYRSSLLIFKYEEQMLSSKLDTSIKEQELLEFYNLHSNNFVVEDDLVKAIYLKIPLTAPDIKNVKKWYKSDKIEEVNQTEQYAYKYATKYDFFKDSWINFSLIKNLLPNAIKDEDVFLQNNNTIEQEDENYVYLVYIREKNLRGSVLQYEMVKSKIKDIIINKRKVKFINDLEKSIYKDAQNQGIIEVFNQEK